MSQAIQAHNTPASPLSPATIMRAAWVIFRKEYNYPTVPFRAIGRRCFNAALRLAWQQAKHTAELAACGVEVLTAELARLTKPHSGRCGLTYYYMQSDALEAFVRRGNLNVALAYANAAQR